MPNKKKILVIYPQLFKYRIPIFNILADKYDLTILHSGKEITEGTDLFKQKVVPIKSVGPFSFFTFNLHKVCSSYDVVISEGCTRYLDRNILILNRFRKYKWINWGIGVSASYNNKFDKNKRFDFVRHYLYKKSEASIFYSDYPIPKYLASGCDEASLFVANNTTAVSYDESKDYQKDSILFVGTLYREKKIYELLDSYKSATLRMNETLPLNIIGDGDEYSNIQHWIRDNKLENKVNLIGSIYEQEKLEPYFRRAIACISPGQAGLSVLTSMGYGTPYITISSAITGGEIFNIKHNETGILYDKPDELASIILDIFNNPQKYIDMGKKARRYYIENRTPEQMANSIIDAIEFVLKEK